VEKHPEFADFKGIRAEAAALLHHCQFDIVMQKQGHYTPLLYFVKKNVIRELGEDHPFTSAFPMLMAGTVIVRKSKVSMQMMHEWDNACKHEQWIDGNVYGEVHSHHFKWWTPEQGLFSVIAANWVRHRTHSIPLNYPDVPLDGVTLRGPFMRSWELGYLQYLDFTGSTNTEEPRKMKHLFLHQNGIPILDNSANHSLSICTGARVHPDTWRDFCRQSDEAM